MHEHSNINNDLVVKYLYYGLNPQGQFLYMCRCGKLLYCSENGNSFSVYFMLKNGMRFDGPTIAYNLDSSYLFQSAYNKEITESGF